MGNRNQRRRAKANKAQLPRDKRENQPTAAIADADPPPAADPAREPATPLETLTAIERRIAVAIGQMLPRHVLFARRLADGAQQDQAAIDTGYSVASARSQGSRMAADPQIRELVELLQTFAILTEAYISKPALRRVLIKVMDDATPAEVVAAVRAAMRLEGYDRVLKVEVSSGPPAADADAFRKDLTDRLARQTGRMETRDESTN